MVGLLHIGRHSDTGQQNHSVPPILIRHTARTEIDAFLKHVRELDRSQPSGARGRLIFALDATASREPTWDIACQLQGDMFAEAAKVGGLDIQLVYYRGSGECRTSRFTSSSRELAATMQKI